MTGSRATAEVEQSSHRGAPVVRRLAWWSAAASVVLAALVAGVSLGAREDRGARAEAASFVAELGALGSRPAAGLPRLSIDRAPPSDSGRGARAVDAMALARLASRVAGALAERADHRALHAAALIDLGWGARSPRLTERAVTQLTTALRLGGASAALLGDLAAAHLAVFELSGDAHALLRAIDAAAHALELDPAAPVARYNLVLALHALGLDDRAAWHAARYRAVDSTTAWARIVGRHGQGPAARRAAPPSPDADPAAVQAFARADPEAARKFGWDVALVSWADGTAHGDAAAAARWLALAESIGHALRARGDGTLAAAAAELRDAAGDEASLARLTARYGRYAVAQSRLRAGDYAGAAEVLATLVDASAARSPLGQWSRVYLGSALVHGGRYVDGERHLRRVLHTGDTLRFPALLGRAQGSLSTSLLRQGRDEDARAALHTAERLFARAGERESLGAAQSMLAENAFLRGDAATGFAAARRTLTTLRTHPHAQWRHNVLYVLAREAAADGLARAARICQDEGVVAAGGTGRAFELVEALLARARLHLGAGRHADADADLRRAQALLPRIPAGANRAWGTADLQLSQGVAALAARPADAVRLIDSSLAFAVATGNVLRQVRALPIRAQAHAAAGHFEAALADLRGAVALLDTRALRLGRSRERAVFYRQAKRVVDRSVLLHLARADARAALVDLERARQMVAARGAHARPTPPAPRGLPWQLPRGETGLVYTRIADTLLVWVVADTTVRLARTVVDSAKLRGAIERVRGLLELRSPDVVARPALADLYDLLVRPADALLPAAPAGAGVRRLVLVADGELAVVPFAALYDRRRSRHLLEDHELRFAEGLGEASVQAARGDGSARPRELPRAALVVADAAFDASAHPEVERLPGARAEADSVGVAYPRAVRLDGARATRVAVQRELARAAVVHYAGHAVFDERRPDRSYLLLAGAREDGRLDAAAIADADLRASRLVVLSSCQTVGGSAGSIGELPGLAGAFRAAGARGVVGSSWKVDDALTRPLMIALHRRFSQGASGPEALRAAQVAMLRSSSPALRTPAAWGAFRYIGS